MKTRSHCNVRERMIDMAKTLRRVWRNGVLFSYMCIIFCRKVKFFLCKSKAALISVYSAFSQTPVYIARPWDARLAHPSATRRACLHCRPAAIELSPILTKEWPSWVDRGLAYKKFTSDAWWFGHSEIEICYFLAARFIGSGYATGRLQSDKRWPVICYDEACS